jgi:hypothetical protein
MFSYKRNMSVGIVACSPPMQASIYNLPTSQPVADWTEEQAVLICARNTPPHQLLLRRASCRQHLDVLSAHTPVIGDYRDMRLTASLLSKSTWFCGKNKAINLWRFWNLAPGHCILHELDSHLVSFLTVV